MLIPRLKRLLRVAYETMPEKLSAKSSKQQWVAEVGGIDGDGSWGLLYYPVHLSTGLKFSRMIKKYLLIDLFIG